MLHKLGMFIDGLLDRQIQAIVSYVNKLKDDAEPTLGNPALNGYLLSSTNAGVRSWVPPPTSAVWGSITGTLSTQTDLQTALAAKQPHTAALDAVLGTNTGDETQATILSKIATSTDGAVLAVQQGSTEAATVNKLVVKNLAGTSTFNVAGNGYVGIGTPTPSFALDVAGQVRISNSGVAGFFIKNTGATFGDALTVGGVGNPNFLANWNAAGVQDDVTKPSWNIGLQVSNDQMVFQRAPAGGALATQMVIKGTGNVGINVATPTSKLHVVGLPVYANNAAALAGGLTAGAFYRTGADPDLLAVVH